MNNTSEPSKSHFIAAPPPINGDATNRRNAPTSNNNRNQSHSGPVTDAGKSSNPAPKKFRNNEKASTPSNPAPT